MNRIQKILSKAERDGTATPFILPEPSPSEDPSDRPLISVTWPEAPSKAVAIPPPPLPHDVTEEPMAESPPSAANQRVVSAEPTSSLVAAQSTSSAAAEHYRLLRNRIVQVEADAPRRVILVTSPSAGDGKTVTVGNLGVTMARDCHGGVVIVDANLRRPRLHALLGIAREPGLVDVLTGTSTLDQALASLPELGLVALTAGGVHDRPGELLGSAAMRGLILDLRRRFERLLLDSAAADTVPIQSLADGVLLVVRAGRTARPAIDRALDLLPAAKVLGFVLNDSRTVGGAPGTSTA
jgi:Mrp family chromosome partitioning ATPase